MNHTGGNLGPVPRREQQHPGCNLPAGAGLSPADTQIVCCFLPASTRNSKLPDNFISDSLTGSFDFSELATADQQMGKALPYTSTLLLKACGLGN